MAQKLYKLRIYSQDGKHQSITVSSLWKGLQQDTTAHGLPNIYTAQGIIKKTFWCLMTIGMLGIFLYIFCYLTEKFFQYQVDVKIQVTNEREIQFPAVTICNTNPIKQSALAENPVIQSLLSKKKKRRKKRSADLGFTYKYMDTDCWGNDIQSWVEAETDQDCADLCYEDWPNCQHALFQPAGQRCWTKSECSTLTSSAGYHILRIRENIAVGKTAWQSSTGHSGTADKAVDGILDPMYSGLSCTHTNVDSKPWFMLDLGYRYEISAVGIVTRGDCCPERLTNFEVRVGDSSSNMNSNSLCLTYPGQITQNPVLNDLDCDSTVDGRYVSVQVLQTTSLTLCEFEVYGLPIGGYDIRNCSVDSPTFHEASGMCVGLYDTHKRHRTGDERPVPKCNGVGARCLQLQRWDLWNFIKSNTELFDGLDLSSIKGYWLFYWNGKWANSIPLDMNRDWNAFDSSYAGESMVYAKFSDSHTWYGTSDFSPAYLGVCQTMVACPNPTYTRGNTTYCFYAYSQTILGDQKESNNSCRQNSQGSRLADIDTIEKQEYLESLNLFPSSSSPNYMWIGLSTTGSSYQWDSGISFSYSNFGGGGHSTDTAKKGAVSLTDYKWYMKDKATEYYYVCQITFYNEVKETTTIHDTTTQHETTTVQDTTTYKDTTTIQHTTIQETTISQDTTFQETTTSQDTTFQETTTMYETTSMQDTSDGILATTTSSNFVPITPVETAPTPGQIVHSQFPEREQYRAEFQQVEKTLEQLANIPDDTKSVLGYQPREFLLECAYSGYTCDPERDFYSFYNHLHGNCYIFNSGWNNTKIRTSHKTGPRYGLQVTVNIGQDEYVERFAEVGGARVVIHHQNQMPFPEDQGVLVKPGEKTDIRMKLIEVNRLGNQYGNCTQYNDDSPRNYSRNVFEEMYPDVDYSLPGCYKTCYQQYVIKTCGCADPSYPKWGEAFGYKDVLSCDSSNITQDDCKYNVTKQYINNELDCHCPIPCRNLIYSTAISRAHWPSAVYLNKTLESFRSFIPDIVDAAYPKYKDNLLKVGVYFEEFNYETISEYPKYKPGTYVSDLGGILGLCLGFSCLTILEFVEFLIDLIALMFIKCTKYKFKQSSSQDKVQAIDRICTISEININDKIIVPRIRTQKVRQKTKNNRKHSVSQPKKFQRDQKFWRLMGDSANRRKSYEIGLDSV